MDWSQREIVLDRAGPDLDGCKIAFLSDIHAGSFLNEADLVRLFETVAAEQPDVVILGGDLINTREREILMFRKPLSLLTPPLGVFAVAGNHDHFWGRDIGLWEAFLGEQGVEVLMNRGVRVTRGADTMWIAGVDDLTEGTPDLRAAVDGAREDEPVVLVAHHPDFFFEAAAVDVDLTLSGHTHGGQVSFLGWTPVKHSKFGWNEGHHELEGAQLYVSRGVGVTFLPLRIGATPEVPLLTLRSRPS
jgi:predicted MPP superfamily phosphohydrolase